MKRIDWVSDLTRTASGRKKGRARTLNQILKDSYRLYARDRVTQKAVKACLG